MRPHPSSLQVPPVPALFTFVGRDALPAQIPEVLAVIRFVVFFYSRALLVIRPSLQLRLRRFFNRLILQLRPICVSEPRIALGGLGAGLICLWMDSFLPAMLLIPLAIMASAAFGAIWGVIPVSYTHLTLPTKA